MAETTGPQILGDDAVDMQREGMGQGTTQRQHEARTAEQQQERTRWDEALCQRGPRLALYGSE